jgi:hypothetical protein
VAFFRSLKKPQRFFYRLPGLFLRLTPHQRLLSLPLLMLLLLNLPLLVFLLTPRLFGFPPRRKVPLRDLDQVVDVLIEGRAQRVQPIQAAEAQPQGAGRANVLDPERDDDRAGVERRHDLVEDIGRGIRRPERIMTKSFACPIASTIDAPQSPKPTSRGAIQQRMPASSSRWQTASAAALSAMV